MKGRDGYGQAFGFGDKKRVFSYPGGSTVLSSSVVSNSL